jgi:hypothetical protein
LENQGAVRPQGSIIIQSAAFVGKYTYDKIVTLSQTERQQSVNNSYTRILDNVTGMKHRLATKNVSAAIVGKNACNNIASASYN